ncbi:MAG: tetratricopeptide repeat protein [Acidobacteriia bacterium]|nr:tetratricopeptide repeat protein [Terriglobia bacterium]
MESSHPSEPPAQNWFHRPWVMELVACGITALANLGTLAFGFVYDDVPQILKNPAIQDWRYLPQYFTSHVWAAIYPNSAGNYYRPLFLLWLRLNYALFGTDPAGWHWTSVLCHVAATYLIFRVAQQLTRDRMTAFAAALLFGLHPAHIENVAWISGVTDPLMACFVLGSCSAFLRFRESRKVWQLGLSLGSFVMALLAKETAIVLPLLIFELSRIRPQSENQGDDVPPKAVAAIREAALYILFALIYLGVRFWALHGFSHPAISLSWTQVLLTWPAVLWFYARHLFLPIGLSEFYALNYLDHATGRGFWLPLAMLAIVALVSCSWVRALSQRRAAWFAVTLIVLPLLPVLDLRSLTAGDIVHDRYLYLPSVGFVLLVALSLREIERRMPSFRAVSLLLAGTGLIALLFAVLTLTQQRQWTNDIQLYTRGVESAPDNLTARDNLANALLAANQPERAIPMYLEVLKRNPGFWRSNYNLGFAYYKLGNPAAAENYLERAIQIDRSDSDEFIYLALVELQLKKLPEAAENARQAIARNPKARGYHFALGLIEEARGDRNAAIAAFKAEVTEHPDDAPAAAELQKIEGIPASPQP